MSTTEVPLHVMLMLSDTAVTDLVEKFGRESGCEWFCLDGERRALEPANGPSIDAIVNVVVRRTTPGLGKWKPFLNALGVPITVTPGPDAESVLVAVRTAGDAARTALFCFGAASQVVPNELVDGRFGLIVALNKLCGGTAIDPWRPPVDAPRRRRRAADSPVSVRQLQADVRSGHRHSLLAKSPSASPVEGLGFDTVTDLLRVIRVLTEDEVMADLDGGRGLRFSTPLSGWEDLVALAEHLVSLRARTDYQSSWDWVDHVVPVAPRAEVERLLRVLHGIIADDVDAVVDMVLPDFDDSGQLVVGRLCFGVGREEAISAPVEWPIVRTHLLRQPTDVVMPLRRRLRLRVAGDSSETVDVADLANLLVAEFDEGDQHYVLSDGELLRVDASFLRRLEARLGRILWSTFPFPHYRGGTERPYLEAAVAGPGQRLAMLDQRNITLEGQTAFEPCDLITDDGRLVFAKLKGPSATFSHLCTQAEASAAMFLRHAAARDALLDKVAEAGAPRAVEVAATDAMLALEKRQPDCVTVTLLLLGGWRRKDLRSLPLLSRLRLQRAADAITDLGYRFEVASPDVELRRQGHH